MSNMPRILPLVGVAIGGVLAINALAGARALPDMVSGAQAFAEDIAKPEKAAKAEKPKDKAAPGKAEAAPAAKAEAAIPATAVIGDAKDVAATSLLPPPGIKPPAVCAPTAAELAKEAGLSPAELQVLQSLGVRRGQLDQRESQLNVQLALLAAAEAKLDVKVRALNGLKGEIKGLLTQAQTQEQAELDRLVKVFEGMKPKDAAPRMVLIDDSVRLPIAAKMKERALSAILAQMPAPEAKKLTESLARRFTAAKTLAANANAAAEAIAPSKPAAAPAPKKAAQAPAAKKTPAAQAANTAPEPAATPAAAPEPKAG